MKSRYTAETSPNNSALENTLGYIDNARNSKDTIGTIKSDFDTHFRSTLHTLTDPVLRNVDKALPDDFHGVLTNGQKVLSSARDNLTSKTSFIANKFNYFLSTLPQSAQLSALLDHNEAKQNDWNKMRHSVERLPEAIQETTAALQSVQQQERENPKQVGFFAFVAGFFTTGKPVQQTVAPVANVTPPVQQKPQRVAPAFATAVPQAQQHDFANILASGAASHTLNIDDFKKAVNHVEEVTHNHPPVANQTHTTGIQARKQANTTHTHW